MINCSSGRRAPAALLLAASSLVLALAGCSGGSDPLPSWAATSGSTPPTTTSTTTPTSGPSSTSTSTGASTATASATRSVAKPVVPESAKHPTGPGAEAYFIYFWETYNYGIQALDTDPLDEASDPKCIFCRNTINAIKQALDVGDVFRGGRVSVGAAVAAPGDPTKGIVVNGKIAQLALATLDSTGKVVVSHSADPPHRVDAFLTWTGDTWRVGAVSPGN